MVLPPYAGVDSGASIGRSLISVDESSVKDIPGIVRIVTIEDFVGIVAEREENAIKAAQALDVTWKSWAGLPNLVELAHALRAHPSTPRTLKDTGNVDAFLSAAGTTLQRATSGRTRCMARLGHPARWRMFGTGRPRSGPERRIHTACARI